VTELYTTKFWEVIIHQYVCLFVNNESHEQILSYLATVTITDDLDLCLALAAFSSEGFFYMPPWGFFNVPHLLWHGTSVLKVISERPVILTSECHALGEGAITTYFKRPRFDAAGTSGARTHDLPDAKLEHYH
jgi:hypothetical protein